MCDKLFIRNNSDQTRRNREVSRRQASVAMLWYRVVFYKPRTAHRSRDVNLGGPHVDSKVLLTSALKYVIDINRSRDGRVSYRVCIWYRIGPPRHTRSRVYASCISASPCNYRGNIPFSVLCSPLLLVKWLFLTLADIREALTSILTQFVNAYVLVTIYLATRLFICFNALECVRTLFIFLR